MTDAQKLHELSLFRDAIRDAGGCRCDPPGSGEEWCVGACHVRAKAKALLTALDELWETLEEHGGLIVPHLIDTDDNTGERAREAARQLRGVL